MKNALLVYEPVKGEGINIGDYIQSIAASQFLKEPYVYINREHLNEYDGEKVKLIMNGWYMHRPENFPPSENIAPLLVAFHINTLAKDKMLSEKTIQWLKLHEPIGCRDHYTEQLLKGKGVNAYFSGCLTLTLGETYKRDNLSGNIYFVDPVVYSGRRDLLYIVKVFLFSLFHFKCIFTICKKKYKYFSLENIYRSAAFILQYSKIFSKDVLLSAEYIQQQYKGNKSENFYFAEADKLLRKYVNAKLVVTSRIHCALPCTGFETPVLYIHEKNSSEVSTCRLDGILELFNVIYTNKGNFENSQNIAVCNPVIKHSYIALKTNLISRCKKFMEP